MLWALKYCGGLMFLSWYLRGSFERYRIGCCLLPPAGCCRVVQSRLHRGQTEQQRTVLFSGFSHHLLSLKQHHWLNFDGWFQALSPGSHLRGDGMRRFRTAKGRQNTMRCFKENTLKLDEECLVSLYTADFSFQQWQKSLGACEKPPPTPDFCVLQFSMPRDGPDK